MSNGITNSELNQHSLHAFDMYIDALKKDILRDYNRAINRDLSSHQTTELLQRNVCQIMQQLYDQSLKNLESLKFDTANVVVDNGFSELTAEALKAFDNLFDEFLKEVIQQHSGSCALSNFPMEHHPSPEYIAQTVDTVGQQWREFALAVNNYFLGQL